MQKHASRSTPEILTLVHEVAREGGDMALRYFRSGQKTSARIWSKTGGSPVTEADIAVDTFLKVRLSEALPEAGWLSEETADDRRRLGRRLVWVVDPIDGTRAFLSGSHDWSVAIALLVDGVPELGVVHVPAHDSLFEARRGGGAYHNGDRIETSAIRDLADIGIAGPVPMIERLEQSTGLLRHPPRVPSLALRLARVAEGSIDAAVISKDARDWDIAAADLILEEAGGLMTGLDGERPVYNRPDPVHGELFASSRRLHPQMIEAMRSAAPA